MQPATSSSGSSIRSALATESQRFRYKTPTKTGRWVATRHLAWEAAVKAGVARWDKADERIYLDALTEIEAE